MGVQFNCDIKYGLVHIMQIPFLDDDGNLQWKNRTVKYQDGVKISDETCQVIRIIYDQR